MHTRPLGLVLLALSAFSSIISCGGKASSNRDDGANDDLGGTDGGWGASNGRSTKGGSQAAGGFHAGASNSQTTDTNAGGSDEAGRSAGGATQVPHDGAAGWTEPGAAGSNAAGGNEGAGGASGGESTGGSSLTGGSAASGGFDGTAAADGGESDSDAADLRVDDSGVAEQDAADPDADAGADADTGADSDASASTDTGTDADTCVDWQHTIRDDSITGSGACANISIGSLIDTIHAEHPELANIKRDYPRVTQGRPCSLMSPFDHGPCACERQCFGPTDIEVLHCGDGFRIGMTRWDAFTMSSYKGTEIWYFETDLLCHPQEVGYYRSEMSYPVSGSPLWGLQEPQFDLRAHPYVFQDAGPDQDAAASDGS